MRYWLALTCLVAVAGCASLLGPPPDTACETFVDELCDAISDCGPVDEGDCRDELDDQVGGCADVAGYEGDLAGCVEDLEGADCDDIVDDDFPPSCDIEWLTGDGERVQVDPPESPAFDCSQYLECQQRLDEIQNTTVTAGLLSTYGPNGSCWTTSAEAAQACVDACNTALDRNHTAYPEVPECEP